MNYQYHESIQIYYQGEFLQEPQNIKQHDLSKNLKNNNNKNNKLKNSKRKN